MKTTAGRAAVLGCVILAVSQTAWAQKDVALYGVIDAAVEHYTNADARGDGLTRMPSFGGGIAPSRLGLRGSEDLGGGNKTIFVLEAGFYPDTGTSGQGDRLFGRQAWVGLTGRWGQLTAGRQYNAIFYSMAEVDVFAASQYGLGPLDPAISNARHDNSLAYKGSFDGVTAMGSYSVGRDTSNAGGPAGTNCPGEGAEDRAACREWSALLRYDADDWGVVAAYDRKHGAPGAAAGLTTGSLTDSRLHLAGYVRAGAWKIGGGTLVRDNQGSAAARRSRITYIGATFRAAPTVTVDVQASTLDVRGSDNDARQVLARCVLSMSKRTAVYVAAGRIRNNGLSAVALSAGGSVGAGMTQTGVITGIEHVF
jgi:predicted porin